MKKATPPNPAPAAAAPDWSRPSRPAAPSPAAAPSPSPKPALAVRVPATVMAAGDGSYIVSPGRPASLFITPDGIAQEVTSREAAKILGLKSRSSMHTVRNDPGCMKYLKWQYLKWRYTTPLKGKCVYDLASVYALQAASAEGWKE